MVPWILIDEQKQRRLKTSTDLLNNTDMYDRGSLQVMKCDIFNTTRKQIMPEHIVETIDFISAEKAHTSHL